ncbi:hypothetical protein AB205_0070000, partial [Aquarana catesbeiana]
FQPRAFQFITALQFLLVGLYLFFSVCCQFVTVFQCVLIRLFLIFSSLFSGLSDFQCILLVRSDQPTVLKPCCGPVHEQGEEDFTDKDQFSHMPLLWEIQENNPDDFRNYLQMTDPVFRCLLALLSPDITKQDTCMRQAITPEQRLITTLQYLAMGRSLQDIKFIL